MFAELTHDFHHEVLIGDVSYMCQGEISFDFQSGEPMRLPQSLSDDGYPGDPDEYDNFSVSVEGVSWEDENDVEQTDINETPIDAIKSDILEHFKANPDELKIPND